MPEARDKTKVRTVRTGPGDRNFAILGIIVIRTHLCNRNQDDDRIVGDRSEPSDYDKGPRH